MRCVIHTRVSTDHQKKEELPVQSQIEAGQKEEKAAESAS